ncbi:MAG TPA: hypothetical protein VKY65_02945 [Alphaproteobacteria bacterium]|nr:hypothetical protein [Alphaproteobacteria bacterium]
MADIPYKRRLQAEYLRHGAAVFVAGAQAPIERMPLTHSLRPPQAQIAATLPEAIACARAPATFLGLPASGSD